MRRSSSRFDYAEAGRAFLLFAAWAVAVMTILGAGLRLGWEAAGLIF